MDKKEVQPSSSPHTNKKCEKKEKKNIQREMVSTRLNQYKYNKRQMRKQDSEHRCRDDKKS